MIKKRFIIFFILLLSILTVISPWLAILNIYILTLYYTLKSNEKTLGYFIYFILFQNIFLIITANYFDIITTPIMILSKELMIYLCVLLGIATKFRFRNINSIDIISILFIILLGVAFFSSDSELFAKMTSVRQLMLPIIFFLFGYYLNIDTLSLKKVIKLIVGISTVISIIGLFEVCLIRDYLWTMTPIYQFNFNKGTLFPFYNDVPLNFYTWDYADIVGSAVRRLVSIFADPLATAGFLFLGFVLANTLKHRMKNIKSKLIEELILIAGLLTLSKGYFLSLSVFIIMRIFRNIFGKNISFIFISLLSGSVLLFSVVSLLATILPSSSIGIHYNGFVNGIESAGFLGTGLGMAGVLTSKLAEMEGVEVRESYIGVLVNQMGFLGLIVFVMFFCIIIWKLLKKYKQTNSILYYNMSSIIIAVLYQACFSESSIGIISTGLYFILAGIFLQRTNKIEVVYEKDR